MARESLASKRERAAAIEERMFEHYGPGKASLDYRTPFELTVAVVLSAQCTDAAVNKVTPRLFAAFPTPAAMAAASSDEVAEIIHSLGFFRSKAKNLVALAQMVTADFGGEVPADVDLLQKLPGLRDEEDAGMDFRLLLHQRTKQLKAAMETPLRYGYYLPNVTDKCFGCGKCEKSCRANALKVEDLPDGQTRIVVTPWKCGECGICVASCSNHGIDGMKLRQLTTLGPVSIYKCTKTLCADCGKPIAPDSVDGICSVCRIKRRTKKRQEEAAARAKERAAEREAKRAAEEAAKTAAEESAKAAAQELAAENAAASAETAVPAAPATAPEAAAPTASI